MPVRIPLPATAGDDPELSEPPIYGRAVPRDVPSFVEARAPGVAPETVVFCWPDGTEAVWDSGIRGGFSMPRVPPRAPRLPQTIREAEMEYEIAVACGVPEDVARSELESHVERIREKRAECQADVARQCSHSPDFTSVVWYGTHYSFSKGNQAEAVRALWEAWEKGEHSLSQETIGDRIGSAAERFELRKVFRTRKPGGGYEPHPAWGTMIVQVSRGCYRFAPPAI